MQKLNRDMVANENPLDKSKPRKLLATEVWMDGADKMLHMHLVYKYQVLLS